MAVHGAASARGQASDVRFFVRELSCPRMTFVSFTSQDTVAVLRGLWKIMQGTSQTVLSLGVGVQSVLWWWAREAGGISILVKKGCLCCVAGRGQPGGTGRGRKGNRAKLHVKQHLPPVNRCSHPLSQPPSFKVSHGAAVGVLPHFLPLRTYD